MKASEFKQIISSIPDDEEINFELNRLDGEIVSAAFESLDNDFTILLAEERIMLEDIFDELRKTAKTTTDYA